MSGALTAGNENLVVIIWPGLGACSSIFRAQFNPLIGNLFFQPWETWEIVRDSFDPGDPPSPAIRAGLAPLATPLGAGVLGRGGGARRPVAPDPFGRRPLLSGSHAKQLQGDCKATAKRYFYRSPYKWWNYLTGSVG